jgi:hypothetical protein
LPFLLNTGFLLYDKKGWAVIKGLQVAPEPFMVPSVASFIQSTHKRSNVDALEIAISNPSADNLVITSLVALGERGSESHISCLDLSRPQTYTVELQTRGSQVIGWGRRRFENDLFAYRVQGSYVPGCSGDHLDFNFPASIVIPARQVTTFRFEIYYDHRRIGEMEWRLLLALSNNLALEGVRAADTEWIQ